MDKVYITKVCDKCNKSYAIGEFRESPEKDENWFKFYYILKECPYCKFNKDFRV